MSPIWWPLSFAPSLAPGGAESAWAVADAWSAQAPLSTEPFWADERLIVRRPIDDHFRAHLGRLFVDTMRDLEPWPCKTYDAIDLGEYLGAHPELGTGDWVVMTNARGEQLVFSRSEIEKEKPVIVVGIDDERNLFRLLVTYNVYRTYTFKPETEPRSLLARPVGAFLHFPNASDAAPHVVTFADFALTRSSFRVANHDPLATVRALPKPLLRTLTGEQGCLQCHSLHGTGARSHHIRAVDGKPSGGDALAFEEYPREVLRALSLQARRGRANVRRRADSRREGCGHPASPGTNPRRARSLRPYPQAVRAARSVENRHSMLIFNALLKNGPRSVTMRTIDDRRSNAHDLECHTILSFSRG